MDRITIIPTGDEILAGTVRDLDSPMVLSELLRVWPRSRVTRIPPVEDGLPAILAALEAARSDGADLAILIGGSGGGHRFSPTLGRDFSHSAMDAFLQTGAAREIYGKNGHLWCRLVCGLRDNMLLINLPGPYVEAQAAIAAFLATIQKTGAPAALVGAMAEAVFAQYPRGSAEPL